MYSASSASGRSGSKLSCPSVSTANTFSVEHTFEAETDPVADQQPRRIPSHPLAAGDGHR